MAVKFGFFVAFVLLALGLTNGSDDQAEWLEHFGGPEDKAPFAPLTNKPDTFDWQLFKRIALDKNNENVVVSPFSVKILLSILKEASDSSTLEELARALVDIPEGKDGYELYQKILKSLEKESEDEVYQLDIGTKLYVGISVTPRAEFLEVIKSVYHTSIDNVDFNERDKTAEKINKWCSEVTNGKINELVKADKLEGIVAVLVNAIYFKGKWVLPFDETDTKPHNFTLKTGESLPVSAMSQSEDFYFFDDELGNGTKLLRMAYKGSKYAMTFILPEKADGLDNVLENITPGTIENFQKLMRLTTVHVILPKFEFETKSELKEILQKLNIRNIFSETAQLPRLGGEVFVSDIIQKAGVKVDEKGTTIFGATEADYSARGSFALEFHALHPFAFFLEDETTGALLFAGKVVNPTNN